MLELGEPGSCALDQEINIRRFSYKNRLIIDILIGNVLLIKRIKFRYYMTNEFNLKIQKV